MEHSIPESDWKKFRQLHEVALERFCQRVLEELVRLSTDPKQPSSHARYGAVFQLIRERDRELAAAFDNPRRSAALMQLVQIRAAGLLTDEEFARFSAATQDWVQRQLEIEMRASPQS